MIDKTILHYKILKKIGEGGMGIVYKAEDTKLKREVAIKFLPDNITEINRNRFEIEAQAAAALNHPNITTIHSIEEIVDSQRGRNAFIVMEYIDGIDLKEKIKSGKIKTEEAIDIAVQIAEGLESAHKKGIIHRDIKPQNIIITKDGKAKIMDFGLAKIKGENQLTQERSTIGTVAYMSPEQIRGEELDQRTDLWSLGVVLYEMLTGQMPFEGEYEHAVQYAVLNKEPKTLIKHNKSIPKNLQYIIDKLLAKNKNRRYQNAGDFLKDLERNSNLLKALSLKRFRIKRSAALGLILIALAVLLIFYFLNKTSFKSIPAYHEQLTFVGNAFYSQISPGGDFISYLAREKTGRVNLYVKDISGGAPIEAFKGHWIYKYRWLPDGKKFSLMDIADSSVNFYIVPRFGGSVKKSLQLDVHCWSPDGKTYAGGKESGRKIVLVKRESGDTSSFYLKGDYSWLMDIDWSPKRNFLLVQTLGKTKSIWTMKPDGSNQQKVLEGSALIYSPRWSKNGDAIYFLRKNHIILDLMKLHIDPSNGSADGEPIKLQSGIPLGGTISLSSDNQTLIYDRSNTFSNLKLVRLQDGKQEITSLTNGSQLTWCPAISPDGKKVTFTMGNFEIANIFVMPIEGGEKKQLTFFDSYNFSPAWSPDGKKIAFGSDEDGSYKVWVVPADGGNARVFKNTRLTEDQKKVVWAPEKDILYQITGNKNFMFLDPQTEKETPLISNDSVGFIFDPCYSPDKKFIAVFWNRKPAGIWLINRTDSSQKFLLKTHTFNPIGWTADGEWIYILDWLKKPYEIFLLNKNNSKLKKFTGLPFEQISSFNPAISADGKTIVISVVNQNSDVWMMKNFDYEVVK